MIDHRDNLYLELEAERLRQERKWGVQHHSPGTWMNILGEEVGEAHRAVNDVDLPNFREELLHCAAVAMAAVEDLDSDHGERQWDEANRLWTRANGR